MAKNKQPLEEDLKELRRTLLEMGVAAQEMVGDAVQALVRQNLAQAEAVILRDDALDRMDQEIEAFCLRLLTQRPGSTSDIRYIAGAMKVATDIERIADHAVDIAKVTRRMGGEAIYKPLVDVPLMAETTLEMVRDAVDAFVQSNTKTVPSVLAADDQVDGLYNRMRGELLRILQADPNAIVQASYLMFIVHYLERIGDHAINIAERVEKKA